MWGQSSEVSESNDNRDDHFANRCILATWHDLWTGGLTLSFLADSDVKAKWNSVATALGRRDQTSENDASGPQMEP